MKKVKVLVIYGGKSFEHDVSVMSSSDIISNLDKNKYDLSCVYIDKDGTWYDGDNKKISNIFKCLKKVDVVFPVLHGLYGEDGTIQGMLEMFGIKYVGSGVLSSALCMDKVYSKIIFEKASMKQARYVYLKKIGSRYVIFDDEFNGIELELDDIVKRISEKLGFPLFVKPSNSGSSIGVNKAINCEELKEYIEYAGGFDRKILIEEGINGREIEFAVLGNDDLIVSGPGEIVMEEKFYNYDAKYQSSETKIVIPAYVDSVVECEMRNLACKAYKALECKGLARIDFFVTDSDVYINEVNTIPGFTKGSMYPKLFLESGINKGELLDKLIELALE